MPATLKDVAKDLGLSVGTISKVLRNHPDISDRTRKRVLERMKELDYQPNYAARALITGRTSTMGLVVPDLLHPFFAHIAKALSAGIREHGYSVIIATSDDESTIEKREIQQLIARRVDVMLVASTQASPEDFRGIAEKDIPLILLDRYFEGFSSNFVGVDDRAVGALATSHLIEQGCRRIAHIRGPEVSTASGRISGYLKTLSDHHISPPDDFIVQSGTSADHEGEEAGYAATSKLLSSRKRPDGIFCFNDPTALGAMRAILDAGLRIPQDVAIVGCGNLLYSDFLRVPLTSVDQASAKIGQAAASLALQLAQSKTTPAPKSKRLKPSLIVRASSLRHTR